MEMYAYYDKISTASETFYRFTRHLYNRGGDLMSNPNAASRFDEIYDSTNKSVLKLITAKCGNTSDISDIFQETYMELYKVLSKRGMDFIKNEKQFVLRIAKRKIARHYSLTERLRLFVPLVTESDDKETVLSDFEAEAFLEKDFSDAQILIESVRQHIASKPDDVQKVFYLMYDMGMTIFEISEALSLSESAVKNKLYRTLKELRELLN